MFTKDKLIKIFATVIIIGAIATLIIFLFPRKENLVVSAENVETSVNETFEIDYKISDPFASISFEAKDDIIEKVEGTINKFLAKSSGETEVEITAYNNNQKVKCVCVVNVLPIKDNEENPTNPDDEPNTNPSNPEENDDNSNTKPDIVNKFTIADVEGDTVVIEEESKFITLNFNPGIDISTNKITFTTDDGIEIEKVKYFSSLYKITAMKSGNILVYNGQELIGKIVIEKIGKV